jgi:hypothetical protein
MKLVSTRKWNELVANEERLRFMLPEVEERAYTQGKRHGYDIGYIDGLMGGKHTHEIFCDSKPI